MNVWNDFLSSLSASSLVFNVLQFISIQLMFISGRTRKTKKKWVFSSQYAWLPRKRLLIQNRDDNFSRYFLQLGGILGICDLCDSWSMIMLVSNILSVSSTLCIDIVYTNTLNTLCASSHPCPLNIFFSPDSNQKGNFCFVQKLLFLSN